MNNCHIFCSLLYGVLDYITFRGEFSENIKYHIQGFVKLVLIIWNNFYLLLPQFHLLHPCLNSPEGCLENPSRIRWLNKFQHLHSFKKMKFETIGKNWDQQAIHEIYFSSFSFLSDKTVCRTEIFSAVKVTVLCPTDPQPFPLLLLIVNPIKLFSQCSFNSSLMVSLSFTWASI